MTTKNSTRTVFTLTFAFMASSLLALGGSALAATIQPGDPLIPLGLGEGDTFQLVFVTSTKTNRDSGGGEDNYTIAFWNDYANTIADGSSLAGIPDLNWSAIASTIDVDARDNALVSAPVYLLNSSIVATGFSDMWDGPIANAILIDESGNTINTSGGSGAGRLVWTGSDAAGFALSNYPLGDGADAAGTGNTVDVDDDWIQNTTAERRGPGTSLRVYALSEEITVVPEPATMVIAAIGLLGLIGMGLRRRLR